MTKTSESWDMDAECMERRRQRKGLKRMESPERKQEFWKKELLRDRDQGYLFHKAVERVPVPRWI